MKLTCIISGKEVNVSPKVFQDRATKYGVNAESLKTSYVSRESKRLIREGKSVDEIRTASGYTGLNAVDQCIIDSLRVKTAKAKSAKTDKTVVPTPVK